MKTTTRTEGVISQLRNLVLGGELGAGLHLTEEMLAEHLKVSRTPVRNALSVLANEGLLLYSPNRGYTVREFALKDILNAYDVRGVLEAMASRLAAEHGLDPVADADFSQIIERSEKVLGSPDWEDAQHAVWRELNLAFHQRVLEVADNRQLAETALMMRRQPRLLDPRLSPGAQTYDRIYSKEKALRSHSEHVSVLDAIRNRQGTRAENLMREHVWRNREAIRQQLPHLAMEPTSR